MAIVRPSAGPQAMEPRQLVDLIRSVPAQARLALGVYGVAWATAAGIVGLICFGVSFAQVTLALHATEVEHRQQNAAEVLALDQATRKLLRTIHLMSYGERQPAEVQVPLQNAWPQFQSALTTVCERPDGEAVRAERIRLACSTGAAMRDILAPEIEAFDPPNRLISRSEVGKAIALVGDFNSLSVEVVHDANALVGRMVENYRTALFVLTLSTAGFSGAGLILILLVGRASLRHVEQSRQATAAARQAGEARDMLQETIDALPAGVVLYDKDERLVMLNTAAASIAWNLAQPGSIGKTFAELAHEEAAGIISDQTPERWIARFRSKGTRHLRRVRDGRWIEWLEKGTRRGGTVGLRVDVTELKTRELELERARAEYQSLVDSMSDMVYALDAKGVFTFASASSADLLGVPAALLTGTNFGDLVVAEDMERANISTRAHLQSSDHAVRQLQLRMKRADGVIRHFEFRYRRPPLDATQSVVAVGVMRDVSERVELTRQLEKQMAEAEHARAEYQALVDSLSDAVYALNVNGVFTFVSAAAAELLGVPAARLIGTRFLDYVAPEDIDQAAVAGHNLIKSSSRTVHQAEIRMMTANRAIRHVEVRYRMPVGGVTRGAAQIGVIRDVEDRVQLTRRLDEKMARLRSIVESSGALIVLVDRTLGVVMINSEFTAVTGLTEEDAVGRPLKQVVDWPLEAAVLGGWLSGAAGLDRAKPTRLTTRMRDRQGRQRLIAVTATPVADERGRVNNIVFLGVDDTERRETEEALFDAERLATVGEMAATVAHEIAQPLQVINVAYASMQDDLADTAARGIALDREFVEQKIDRIGSQVERAGRIISELRAFVRGTSLEMPGRFDPAVAVRSAVDLTQHSIRLAGIALQVSLAGDLPTLVGHVGKLEQVLVNLINNACDAGGRSIEVSAAALYRDGALFVRITVEDDGPGIAANVLPRLFDSFVTTKAQGKGTGLGLRICRRIVEEMGGSIAAANCAERGARFEILLPEAPAGE